MLAYRCFDSSVDRADPRIDVDALRRYCGNDGVFSRGFPGFLWLLGWASRGDRDLRARFILILNGEERPLGELPAEHWPDASFDLWRDGRVRCPREGTGVPSVPAHSSFADSQA
jgi:hypothetical protein